MKIPIEHALNIIQTEIEEIIYQKMQESQISAGLIEKILEGILCQIRKLKNQDLEKIILEMNKKMPEILEEKIEKKTAKINDTVAKRNGNL